MATSYYHGLSIQIEKLKKTTKTCAHGSRSFNRDFTQTCPDFWKPDTTLPLASPLSTSGLTTQLKTV